MSGAARSQGGEDPPSASPDPFIGRLVAERFRVVELVARGGMGRVYEAIQLPLERRCALKILNPRFEGDDDPEFQRRFFLEAATAAKLSHPNTVTVFDYGRDGDVYYIAMEYIEGRTLYRALRDDGPFEEARVIRIMKQVSRSLREAHELGVIHRDMKPGNVLLVETSDEPDTVKVLDFGLVKPLDDNKEDLTQEGMFLGSPKYMAPEQILGNPVSEATDVYALGIVAYELICGVPPFDDGTSVKTMLAHLHKPLPSLRDRMDGRPLSAEFEAVLARTLAKDPGDRFESMNALLQVLHLFDSDGSRESMVGPRVWEPAATGSARLVSERGSSVELQDATEDPTVASREVAPRPSREAPGDAPSRGAENAADEASRADEGHGGLERTSRSERPSRQRWLAMALGTASLCALAVALFIVVNDPSESRPAISGSAQLGPAASTTNEAHSSSIRPEESSAPTSSSLSADVGAAITPQPSAAATSARTPATTAKSSPTARAKEGRPQKKPDTPTPRGYKASPY